MPGFFFHLNGGFSVSSVRPATESSVRSSSTGMLCRLANFRMESFSSKSQRLLDTFSQFRVIVNICQCLHSIDFLITTQVIGNSGGWLAYNRPMSTGPSGCCFRESVSCFAPQATIRPPRHCRAGQITQAEPPDLNKPPLFKSCLIARKVQEQTRLSD